ncbi:CHAT domain-containing protein [Microcoleus sp. FACHB-672]|uniref:CHAT domain-containing protein n=1 Tax=Microcoleus sp. FACHB-672 TaxID=2692825 RepID=UPI0016886759|nr:CHAT domain-containing protein [Microcoleus sp. FACHB-672]MBD2041053.1 CHAT domain-containing protein [Microcoleus sp. FACHB-672]
MGIKFDALIKRLFEFTLIVIITLFSVKLVNAKTIPNSPQIDTNPTLISQFGNFSDATGPSFIEGTSNSVNSQTEGVTRTNFEKGIQTAGSVDTALQLFEQSQAIEFAQYFRKEVVGKPPSVAEISQTLCNLSRITGNKSALIYLASLAEELRNLYILPNSDGAAGCDKVAQTDLQIEQVGQQVIPEANRNAIKETVTAWREEIGLPPIGSGNGSLDNAQKLYQWLVKPLENGLKANQIDTLVFTMDAGLRSIPIAALHDGTQFLIEKYNVALIPSFGLTDTRYVDVRNLPILAMGASEFEDASPLPAVPVELSTILRLPWQGVPFLNKEFTLENLKSVYRQQRFRMIHFATHGKFVQGNVSQSYIQFGDSKLRLDRLREVAEELNWAESPTVEMLVLSACETALGDEPELGFAGLAVQAGVKSALASLWRVDDRSTLALMSEFYLQLSKTPIKTEALRQAQLGMLRGKVRIEEGKLLLSEGNPILLPPKISEQGNLNFSHPHYWAGFTLIGNWN